MDIRLLIACAIALGLLMTTTSIHFEALRSLGRLVAVNRISARSKIPLILTCIVAAHLIEIGCYAAAYALGAGPLHLGYFLSVGVMKPLDYIYYSSETYSALGYGDIFPVGYLRLIASIRPLNGSLLLAWSGSFLFLLIRDHLAQATLPPLQQPHDPRPCDGAPTRDDSAT